MDAEREAIVQQMVSNEADMAYRRRVYTIFEWLDPQPSDIILDGGCGRGFYPRFIRHVVDAKVVGVELDWLPVSIARDTLHSDRGVTLVNANLYNLPFPHNYFDKAIMSEVLEHVDDDVRALCSMMHVLKPGGLLAITVPNANYPLLWDPINRTLEDVFDARIRKGPLAGLWANHVRLYTADELRQAVFEAGFEVIEERAFTHFSFPFIHNIVYGFGKEVLEAGLLPKNIASAADRHNLSGHRGSSLNPVNIGLSVFELFDRKNVMSEPDGRPTVNLCILARKPN